MEFVQILGDLLMLWVWQASGAAMWCPQCAAARRAVASGGVRDAATMHGPVDDSRVMARLAGHFRPIPSFFKHGAEVSIDGSELKKTLSSTVEPAYLATFVHLNHTS